MWIILTIWTSRKIQKQMDKLEFIVDISEKGVRLDVFLSEKLLDKDISRSRIKTLCEDDMVLVNDKPQRAGYALRASDKIEVSIPDAKTISAKPQDIDIEIIYEDDSLAIVNKPQGMVVHPAPGSEDGTLVNALLFKLNSLSSINGVIRPGIVHRLDKDTSGLLVIAKTDEAHTKLSADISKKTAKRFYYALVDGNIKEDSGTICQPIGRCHKDRKKMDVTADGRYAETNFKVLERFGNRYTFCEFELKTGRTHQIRVHAKFIHHPVVGDDTYGGSNEFKLNGQLLHAYKLCIRHPKTGENMEFIAPLPPYFKLVLEKLRNKY